MDLSESTKESTKVEESTGESTKVDFKLESTKVELSESTEESSGEESSGEVNRETGNKCSSFGNKCPSLSPQLSSAHCGAVYYKESLEHTEESC